MQTESASYHPTYSPEVVDKHIEHAKQHNQHNGRDLRLEPNRHHHTRHQAKQANNDASKRPLPREDEANEQENQQHPSRQLDILLPILLINRREARKPTPLPHPAIAQHHQQAPHDGQVAEEEVQIEDQAVAEGLRDHDGEEAAYGVFAVFADDDQGGAGGHGDNVEEEEGMCDSPRN